MARPRKQIDQRKLSESIRHGKSIRTIAGEMNVAQNTIRRFIREAHAGLSFSEHRDIERNLPRT